MGRRGQTVAAIISILVVIAGFGYIVTKAGFPTNASTVVGGDKGGVILKAYTKQICVPEETDITLENVSLGEYFLQAKIIGSPTKLHEKFYMTELEIADAVNTENLSEKIKVTLEKTHFNGYPGMPDSSAPGQNPLNPVVRFTTPDVNDEIFSKSYESKVKLTAREFMKSQKWGTLVPNDMISLQTEPGHGVRITVEHKNSAPVILAVAHKPVEKGDGKFDLYVEADVKDEEGNEIDVLFEISNDDFQTILDQYIYKNIDAQPNTPLKQSHDFKDLTDGHYKWRVKTIETGIDIKPTCDGGQFEIPANPKTSNQPETEVVLTVTTVEPPEPDPIPEPDPTSDPIDPSIEPGATTNTNTGGTPATLGTSTRAEVLSNTGRNLRPVVALAAVMVTAGVVYTVVSNGKKHKGKK
ncbi:MAG: hypothetical protein QY318_00170 [Candidatus Dojkabacteria bacterium]|nr:MAG: hypothetical protein QY318_00170 [Candidatus Dojkabacteria bacterium]